MATIEDIRKEYHHLVEQLATQRDELKVNIHLAGLEIREEWAELEQKWEHFRAKSEHVMDIVDDSAEDVGEAAVLLGEEIKHAYHRLKKLLT